MSDGGTVLTVVVPAYNEAARLEQPLQEMSEYLAAQPYAAELLVVDDGSSDATFELVARIAETLAVPIRALRYTDNRGKGFALKVGFAHATGDRILFTDADLATPIEESARLLEAIDAGCDVAIGSRKMPGARIEVHQPWYRERMGKAFTWLVRRLLADVSDVTCGFKAFRAEAGRDLFARLRIEDWAFDAELLFLATKRGYRICEVPVRWHDQAGTKVRLLRDSISSLRGLVAILRAQRAGSYERPVVPDVDLESWPCG